MNRHIEPLAASAYTVPTDEPESDGTAEWSSTTLILVELAGKGCSGIGYGYADEGCVPLIRETLFPILRGKNPFDIRAIWNAMNAAVRNFGRAGMPSSAIAAVEMALWDLKARLLNLSMTRLLGAVREKIPVYGSGGFTSYSGHKLKRQLAGWIGEGISMVKMKVGREPSADLERVQWARQAIGKKTQLFVDANGAYSVKQALHLAQNFSEQDVSWFEEPVSADNLEGLRFLRERAPAKMEIAAGEYNYDLYLARRMLESQSVDVLQADATRCGITGFFQMSDWCDGFGIPLSAHTAPALHAHLCCVATPARHVEYFHDHVRLEQLFFEGATVSHKNGFLAPDVSEPGFGLKFKRKDARKYQINI